MGVKLIAIKIRSFIVRFYVYKKCKTLTKIDICVNYVRRKVNRKLYVINAIERVGNIVIFYRSSRIYTKYSYEYFGCAFIFVSKLNNNNK